jgi:hypothetical protein
MKCPKCHHEWTPRKTSLARELGAKGGTKSRRSISPLAQIKMQAGRLKGTARTTFDHCKDHHPQAGGYRTGWEAGYNDLPSRWEGSSMQHAAWLAGRFFKLSEQNTYIQSANK